ncbi:hypothetical protein M2475_001485 [Breznakia sp. PF5-3]|uniref:hypothetical protein n=1 Tax=unclassified Breznakia TaxID=2623764 RepID=UPI002406B53D|nr:MULTISPECIES: hypothetical protein [unclassified Breznakia]MDF9825064.1 hypothetical protein [Breznakia sp. PM6-1]MDF9835911.1 hypothetical protein [Breznakia sp. PF5-3]MDF9837372.1 hypothetical protein [Breznakia sp. PFB2-8]MDF9859307.1 hypothetical protein [Breznakia sp. PH5-24]
MKVLKKIVVIVTVSIIGICSTVLGGNVHADEKGVQIQYDYDGTTVSSNRTIKEDETTNLLNDEQGNNLQQKEYNDKQYDLKEISISRYRQKVRIEYYVGNYNASTFIGADEGYADYEDYIGDYIKKIGDINAMFNQNLPMNYMVVPYNQNESFSYISEYEQTEDPYVVKVLVAEVKKYNVSAIVYQNRQDKMNPDPIGMTKAEIDSMNDFWKVYTLNTSFTAVVGQSINLKYVGQFYDTTTYSNRKGTLKHMGFYDNTNTYGDSSIITITDATSTSLDIAGFYEVEDYGNPAVKPSSSSAVTSGSSIGFSGNTVTWKTPVVTETLKIEDDVHMHKLSAYPFHLDDDPFDHPEYILYYLSDNWILAHKLTITYHYESDEELVITPVDSKPKDSTKLPVNDTKEDSKRISMQSVKTSDASDINHQFLLLGFAMMIIISVVSYQKYTRKEL